MAIQNRRGVYSDFDRDKLLPAEWAVVMEGEPDSESGESVYVSFKAGNVKRMATLEDMKEDINLVTADIQEELKEGVDEAIKKTTDVASAAQNIADNIQRKLDNGELIGATGPTGPEGPQGIQGPGGKDGKDGLPGAPGSQGPEGPAGPKGESGATGAGEPGPVGPTGANGTSGATGATGAQGPAGKDGEDGATGPMGPQGVQGPEGPKGELGPKGATGPQGLQGAQGPKGEQGDSGVTVPISGMFTLTGDADGNLYAVYADGSTPPGFEVDASGNIYYITPE